MKKYWNRFLDFVFPRWRKNRRRRLLKELMRMDEELGLYNEEELKDWDATLNDGLDESDYQEFFEKKVKK